MKEYWTDLLTKLDKDGVPGRKRLAAELPLDVASLMNRVRSGKLPAVAFPTVVAMCQELDPPIIPDPRHFRWKRDDNLEAFLSLLKLDRADGL